MEYKKITTEELKKMPQKCFPVYPRCNYPQNFGGYFCVIVVKRVKFALLNSWFYNKKCSAKRYRLHY